MAKNYITKSFDKIDASKETIPLEGIDISWINWTIQVHLKTNADYENSDLWEEDTYKKEKIKNWVLKWVTWSYIVDQSSKSFTLQINEGGLTYGDKDVSLNGTSLQLVEQWFFVSSNWKITIKKFNLPLKKRVIKFNKTITENPKKLLKTRYKFALALLWLLSYEWISYTLSNKFKWGVETIVNQDDTQNNYYKKWESPVWKLTDSLTKE